VGEVGLREVPRHGRVGAGLHATNGIKRGLDDGNHQEEHGLGTGWNDGPWSFLSLRSLLQGETRPHDAASSPRIVSHIPKADANNARVV
jgi:hypothetical protein